MTYNGIADKKGDVIMANTNTTNISIRMDNDVKAKADKEIDLDDFIEILEKYTINFNF